MKEFDVMEQQERMLQFFVYNHLPVAQQTISKPFGDLANLIVTTLPQNAERTVALRKLLEAKDCAVRATIEGANWSGEDQKTEQGKTKTSGASGSLR
jgi:hypothetical protein